MIGIDLFLDTLHGLAQLRGILTTHEAKTKR